TVILRKRKTINKLIHETIFHSFQFYFKTNIKSVYDTMPYIIVRSKMDPRTEMAFQGSSPATYIEYCVDTLCNQMAGKAREASFKLHYQPWVHRPFLDTTRTRPSSPLI
ncbi:hypothetical protein ACROYT_G040206, partial [Oculina patagonica]